MCHSLGMDPTLKVMIASGASDKAEEFTTFCKHIISTLAALDPLFEPNPIRDSNHRFDVKGAGVSQVASTYARGIFSQMTGGRAGLVILDDVEVPNTSETQGMRERLRKRTAEVAAIDDPISRKVYLGTPQCEETLYDDLVTDRGYTRRIYPVQFPAKPEKYGDELAPIIADKLEENPELAGEPTDPSWFDEVVIERKRGEFGEAGFQLQFMLDTELSDRERYPLHLSDLIVMPVDAEVGPERVVWGSGPDREMKDLVEKNPGLRGDRFNSPMSINPGGADWIPWQACAMAIDPAGEGKDELAFAVGKLVHGTLHVPEVTGLPGGFRQPECQLIAQAVQQHGVRIIIVEQNFGGGMFEQVLAPYLQQTSPCQIETVFHSKQKELRIADTLEPVMNQHRLVIAPSVIHADAKMVPGRSQEAQQRYRLFHQMTRLTRQRGALAHDDRLDALAMVVAYFKDALGTSEIRAINARQEEEADQEIERFVAGFQGRPVREKTWISTNRGCRR